MTIAPPRVKICGLTRESDVDAAVAAGTDALGFVVDVPVDTPREIPAERAATLVDRVPPFVSTVLVTMPDDAARAIDLAESVGADAVQVHGGLAPDECGIVHDAGHDTIVAVDAGDPDVARRYADAADALLVDSTDADGAGGTGRTHDWERTRALAASVDVPVVLAGGLTPGNVADAVRTVEPYGVDVASGVEARGGEKDHEAVASFVAAAGTATEPPADPVEP